VPRLRRSQCARSGLTRRRHGKGFSYFRDTGERERDPEVIERIKALAIPPAWSDVWICPWPNGHIQATGVDDAGRRQYRYHDEWYRRQSDEKFDRVLEFATLLPSLRPHVADDLARSDITRERVLAAAVRLLDIGYFRLGSEVYAEEHETFGVATLRRDHVRLEEGLLAFDYPAKGSIQRSIALADDEVADVNAVLKRRRGGDRHLLAWKDGRRWVEVRSDDINAYIKAVMGDDYSAKDFRTWSATLLAAVECAATGPVGGSATKQRRAEAAVVATVAEHLGNTPAVCRASYIDPRVFDRFEAGETVALKGVEGAAPGFDVIGDRAPIERAVIALISGHEASEASRTEQRAA
jgi:DNA topoisomerase-1